MAALRATCSQRLGHHLIRGQGSGRFSFAPAWASLVSMSLQMLLNQAVALHREGRLAEAEMLYRQVLSQSPPSFQLQYRLALLQHQQQRPQDGLKTIDAALALQPDAVEALVLQGVLKAALGAPEAALASFARALAIKPDSDDASYNRAL